MDHAVLRFRRAIYHAVAKLISAFPLERTSHKDRRSSEFALNHLKATSKCCLSSGSTWSRLEHCQPSVYSNSRSASLDHRFNDRLDPISHPQLLAPGCRDPWLQHDISWRLYISTFMQSTSAVSSDQAEESSLGRMPWSDLRTWLIWALLRLADGLEGLCVQPRCHGFQARCLERVRGFGGISEYARMSGGNIGRSPCSLMNHNLNFTCLSYHPLD